MCLPNGQLPESTSTPDELPCCFTIRWTSECGWFRSNLRNCPGVPNLGGRTASGEMSKWNLTAIQSSQQRSESPKLTGTMFAIDLGAVRFRAE
jgi:hypothetical protein